MESRLTTPIYERVHADVINPEIPTRPKKRLELLNRCLGAKAYGRSIEGVTAHHITPQGMQDLKRQPNLLEPARGPQY